MSKTQLYLVGSVAQARRSALMQELPKAIAEAEFTICGVIVKCAVLDNGMRVFEQESFEALIAKLEAGVDMTEIDRQEYVKAYHFAKGYDVEGVKFKEGRDGEES